MADERDFKIEDEIQDIRFKFILNDTLKEIHRQDQKWGKARDNHPLVWLSILTEEVGEVATEINDADFEVESLGKNYRDELIQIASVALLAVLNFDTKK